MPQALYCHRDTQMSLELMYIIHVHEIHIMQRSVSPSGIAYIKFVQSDHFSFQHVVVVKFHHLMGQYGFVSVILLGWELHASYITV